MDRQKNFTYLGVAVFAVAMMFYAPAGSSAQTDFTSEIESLGIELTLYEQDLVAYLGGDKPSKSEMDSFCNSFGDYLGRLAGLMERINQAERTGETLIRFDRVQYLLRETAEQAGRIQMLNGRNFETLKTDTGSDYRAELREDLRSALAMVVEYQLELEGASILLTSNSLEEVKTRVVDEALYRLESKLLTETQQLLFNNLIDRGSGQDLLRASFHYFAKRELESLLFNLTGSGLVVSLAGGIIINWIGPKLEEALRNKGNLDFRTERSIGTLQRRLDALGGIDYDSSESSVRDQLHDSVGAIRATRFLLKDLRRANREDLRGQLMTKLNELAREVEAVRKQWYLDEELEDAWPTYRGMIENLRAKLECDFAAENEPPNSGWGGGQENVEDWLTSGEEETQEDGPLDPGFYVIKKSGDGYELKYGGHSNYIRGYHYGIMKVDPGAKQVSYTSYYSVIPPDKSISALFGEWRARELEGTKKACEYGPRGGPGDADPEIWVGGPDYSIVDGPYASRQEALDAHGCEPSTRSRICLMWEREQRTYSEAKEFCDKYVH